MLRFIITVAVILIVGLLVYRGCSPDGDPLNDGPMENAGEKVDDAIEKVGDWLEDTGKQIDKKAHDDENVIEKTDVEEGAAGTN